MNNISLIEKQAVVTAQKEVTRKFINKEIKGLSFVCRIVRFISAIIMFFAVNTMSSRSKLLKAAINIILPLVPMAVIYPMQCEQHRRTYVNNSRKKAGKHPCYNDLLAPYLNDDETRGGLLLLWQLSVFLIFLPTWFVLGSLLNNFPSLLGVNAFMKIYSVCDYFYENHLLGFTFGFFINFWLICGGSGLIEDLKGCVTFRKNKLPQINIGAILDILRVAITQAVILPVKCNILAVILTAGIYFSLWKENISWV